MQLVLQGPLRPESREIVLHYLQWEAVERIIVSCWETCPPLDLRDERVLVLYNHPVQSPGTNNVNRQIYSSARGLALVTSSYAAKLRVDQKIALESLRMMDAFYWRHCAQGGEAAEAPAPGSNLASPALPAPLPAPIFVAGNYTRFPFHPRDHVFWGRTDDLRRLFTLPFCSEPPTPEPDFTRVLRPEAWLGAYYCARFDARVARFMRQPELYLVDGAPRLGEALAVHDQLRERVFKVFPRIAMQWPKYGLEKYHYEVGASLSEYWHEAAW